ncbi:hypothetical protein VcPa08_00869 [Vibrio cholerae]|nr:hypothetical protein VcPa01_01230 [Vibrio cholerae]GFK36714.1 hypothetical protein VcPa02_01275 [Vibrio cholerae]GFK40455.1 hypothetical protein VcPa03_01524 [Vibrio cholerae]GFK44004.1 hypothetical protein VcPa04_01522 [Vibrio cholerae]GFK47549.1 hypothetical protein VcPa05_01520 [Vibrio cholerae]
MIHCEEYSESTSHRVKINSDICIVSSYKNYADPPYLKLYQDFLNKKIKLYFFNPRQVKIYFKNLSF